MKIVSGGQTGVDRAALDAAIENGFKTGGWCPKGRLAEDGSIPAGYELKETVSADYSERTGKNVAGSDGTLILNIGKLSGGTALTAQFAKRHCKPLFIRELSSEDSNEAILDWVREKKIKVLNIAGPRESSSPGIYRKAFDFISELLVSLGKDSGN